MKRIDNTWWRGSDGFYKEIRKGVYEGPFANTDEEPVVGEDSTVVDSGSITVFPIDKDK